MRNLKDFSRKQINKIAKDYANFPVTRTFFVELYDISQSTFYSILQKAIIEHIVDIDTVYKIRERAISNMSKKREKVNTNMVYLHYENLLEKRNNFVFCKKERKRIITEFANRDKRIPKKYFCKEQCISIELLDKVLITGICYNEIPKKLYTKIKNDSLIYNNNSKSVLNFFEKIENIRDSINNGKKVDINEIYTFFIQK